MKEITDLEICGKIASIVGLNWWNKGGIDGIIGLKPPFSKEEVIFNPLKDDGLCFQLMIKYGVTIIFGDVLYKAYTGSITTPMDAYNNDDNFFFDFVCEDASPNKAICLVIIKSETHIR